MGLEVCAVRGERWEALEVKEVARGWEEEEKEAKASTEVEEEDVVAEAEDLEMEEEVVVVSWAASGLRAVRVG